MSDRRLWHCFKCGREIPFEEKFKVLDDGQVYHPKCAKEKPRNLAKPNAQPPLSDVTERKVNSACMSYRHDFGLLTDEEQDKLRSEAKEWLRAWKKEFGHFA